MQDREISDTRVSKQLKSYPSVSEISLSCTFCRCLILFLTFISSCVLFDSYVLLADDHVNNVSYFPFMSIKKVIRYFCILREGYYVIIWLIFRICVFIKDWKLICSELFILKRKSMENWFFCLALVTVVKELRSELFCHLPVQDNLACLTYRRRQNVSIMII